MSTSALIPRLRIAGVINNDLANGPGVRTSIFVSGCNIKCSDCQNKELQDFDKGVYLTPEVIDKIVLSLTKDNVVRGVSILGGEPLDVKNENGVLFLIQELRRRIPKLNIWLWTGYTHEDLRKRNDPCTNEILKEVNCFVDGPFISALKGGIHQWRGSSNQRIIF